MMIKKSIIIAVVLVLVTTCSQKANAQGYTLRFNAALLVSALDTVPAGKLWKVESVMHSSDLNATGTNVTWSSVSSVIKINGTNVYINRTTSGSARNYTSSYVDPNAVSDINLTSLPMWLPAGTTIAASTNVNYISIIEFNLTTP